MELSMSYDGTQANFTEDETQEIRNIFQRPEVVNYLSTGSEAAQSAWQKIQELDLVTTPEHAPSN